jgi:hypothetical protein
MNAARHSAWHRQTRGYRRRHNLVAVAEAIAVGLILVPIATWGAAIVALLWLGGRLASRPSDRQLAARIEANFPQLADKIVPMLELTESPDPDSVKGSPDLIQSHTRDVENLMQSIDLRPMISVRPLLVLLTTAVLVNLGAILHLRNPDATGITEPVPLPLAQAAQTPRVATSPEQRLKQLQDLQNQLRLLPNQVLRQLPAHARSLENALKDAQQAGQDRANQEWNEATELEANVTDSLAELARMAGSIPELQDLANEAALLAKAYADAAGTAGGRIAAMTGTPGSNLAAESAPDKSPRGALPPVAKGQGRWMANTETLRDTAVLRFGMYSQDYAPQIIEHFGQLASP